MGLPRWTPEMQQHWLLSCKWTRAISVVHGTGSQGAQGILEETALHNNMGVSGPGAYCAFFNNQTGEVLQRFKETLRYGLGPKERLRPRGSGLGPLLGTSSQLLTSRSAVSLVIANGWSLETRPSSMDFFLRSMTDLMFLCSTPTAAARVKTNSALLKKKSTQNYHKSSSNRST